MRLTDTERHKLLAELRATDRLRDAEFREAYARNAELNAQIEARRNEDNPTDCEYDVEHTDGTEDAEREARRGW